MNRTSYSEQQRKRIAGAKGRESQRRPREPGNYLVGLLGWAWFVTITFPRTLTRAIALAQVRSYLRDLERAARRAIGWSLVVEIEPSSGFPHAHALIAGVKHLCRSAWWRKAFQRFGRSEIQQFVDDDGGEFYVADHAVKGSGYLYIGGGLLAGEKSRRKFGSVTIVRLNQIPSVPDALVRSRHQKHADRGPKPTATSSATTNRVYVDGSGMRPDGTGSGCAWLNVTTGMRRVVRIDGLSNNQAEYWSLILALRDLPKGEEAELFSDSELVVCQFNGKWAIRDLELQRLLKVAQQVIRERHLKVTLKWVPRSENIAGKLL